MFVGQALRTGGRAYSMSRREGKAFPSRGRCRRRRRMRWRTEGQSLSMGAETDRTTPHPSSGLRGTPDATFPSRGRLWVRVEGGPYFRCAGPFGVWGAAGAAPRLWVVNPLRVRGYQFSPRPVGRPHAPPEGGDEPAGRSQSDSDTQTRGVEDAAYDGGAEGSSRCAGMSLPYGSANWQVRGALCIPPSPVGRGMCLPYRETGVGPSVVLRSGRGRTSDARPYVGDADERCSSLRGGCGRAMLVPTWGCGRAMLVPTLHGMLAAVVSGHYILQMD